MLHGCCFLEVLAKLWKLDSVLASQFLHKGDGFSLVHDEFLVPGRCEVLELLSVLLLYLHFFACMLIYKRDLEASLCLLSNFYDLGKLVLCLVKVAFSLVFDSLCINSLAK